ncbi:MULTISPECIES: hypothetical protein [Pseudomonas]|nr:MULTISPECIES: hypothetical protein [Pseudomonas]SCW81727.1 hypothetical protein SAMN03159424_03401 [Pseudomonas sp. NFACC05-1]SDX99157.1 hypothetical protein SAMN03159474_04384 [Pseudomonas sp. NFACC08-1]SEJ84140.1 hypothetical protein SAMN03159298_04643 [Pseudomonas sp. NFACC07-1]SFL41523.1 hypothetical protein SAMN03159307_02426 [Pseudomonas sp. NFACC46-3]
MVATSLRATYAGLPRSLAYSYQAKNTVANARVGKFALGSRA